MKVGNGGEKSPANQRVKTAKQEKSFADRVRDMYPRKGKKLISETELFASLINERLGTLKGEKAQKAFKTNFREQLQENGGDIERAASRALKRTRVEGHITVAQAHRTRNQSYGAAQLDENIYRLKVAGEGRSAKVNIDDALQKAEGVLEAYSLGTAEILNRRDRREANLQVRRGLRNPDGSIPTEKEIKKAKRKKINGKTENPKDGDGGFLFKPESDHGGLLVVLLPSEYGSNVQSLAMKDKKGKVIEMGRSTGFANGNREHFRFNQTGAAYPRNITMEVLFKNGEKVLYEIANPAERYD